MQIREHTTNNSQIAEITSNEIIIQTTEDALDLLGNVYYQGFNSLILHQKNITPNFFELKNKMAGDILQKFSTYRVRLAIVGDFSGFTSQSLEDFIFESNKGRQVNFVSSVGEALNALTTFITF